MARNEGEQAVQCLEESLRRLKNKSVIVVNIPYRHDLPSTSCVNVAVAETNCKYSKLCAQFPNVRSIDAHIMTRDMYTSHGLHLNKAGKTFIASEIYSAVNKIKMHMHVVKPTFLDKWLATKNVKNNAKEVGNSGIVLSSTKPVSTLLDKWLVKSKTTPNDFLV